MLVEFALEPSLLCSWQEFRYFIEKFGAHHGRLISRYPKHWKRLVYEAANAAADLEKARIIERLKAIDDRLLPRFHEWDQGHEWLENAEIEHTKRPFHAIICRTNPDEKPHILASGLLDETSAQFQQPRSVFVRRRAADMSGAIAPLLSWSRQIVFVDPHFGPDSGRHRRVLAAFLMAASTRHSSMPINQVAYHTATSATDDFLRSECQARLPALLPDGVTLVVRRWPSGVLHNRYVLTEKTGVQFGNGLDEGDNPPEDLVQLIDSATHDELWARFVTSPGALATEHCFIVRRAEGGV